MNRGTKDSLFSLRQKQTSAPTVNGLRKQGYEFVAKLLQSGNIVYLGEKL